MVKQLVFDLWYLIFKKRPFGWTRNSSSWGEKTIQSEMNIRKLESDLEKIIWLWKKYKKYLIQSDLCFCSPWWNKAYLYLIPKDINVIFGMLYWLRFKKRRFELQWISNHSGNEMLWNFIPPRIRKNTFIEVTAQKDPEIVTWNRYQLY